MKVNQETSIAIYFFQIYKCVCVCEREGERPGEAGTGKSENYQTQLTLLEWNGMCNRQNDH